MRCHAKGATGSNASFALERIASGRPRTRPLQILRRVELDTLGEEVRELWMVFVVSRAEFRLGEESAVTRVGLAVWFPELLQPREVLFHDRLRRGCISAGAFGHQ